MSAPADQPDSSQSLRSKYTLTSTSAFLFPASGAYLTTNRRQRQRSKDAQALAVRGQVHTPVRMRG
jgi:hypothetical protein